ncbi:BTB/POZ domain-containing protein KCTD9 [Operophtera brumata]|uniref:BTB/POZ domain-containing protein KCTD9 n=1 Tax=Operophtera brumata TaxID=104452 RepID=A0A0L7L5F6_OPEBR|nr:BTB/POZ domain-containing protein KCTD9 [Operophtera brumata]
MKRAYVYKNKDEDDGKVLVVEDSMEALKTALKNHYELNEENVKIYFGNGCEILDIRVIRDDEKIYLSMSSSKGGKVCDIAEKFSDKLTVGDGQSKAVSGWITLNVGGRNFTTSRSTLLAKEPLSMLARMFADDNNVYLMNPSVTDANGAFLIDRSPEYFEPILNYLRHGVVVLDTQVNPRGVLEEAYACLSRCNLSGANLSHCCLERADLSHANLEGTQLLGSCDLSGSDLHEANLRGANLKDAAFELMLTPLHILQKIPKMQNGDETLAPTESNYLCDFT